MTSYSGVKIIAPPGTPSRVTCKLVKRENVAKPPTVMEGEALASQILEMEPVGARFTRYGCARL